MQISIEPHTLLRAEARGVSIAEITEVLRNGPEVPAKSGRLSKSLIFDGPFMRNKKLYPQKRVEVIFIQRGDAIITVTVYAMYGIWN